MGLPQLEFNADETTACRLAPTYFAEGGPRSRAESNEARLTHRSTDCAKSGYLAQAFRAVVDLKLAIAARHHNWMGRWEHLP